MQKVFSHTRNLEKGRLFMIYPTNTGKSGEHLRLTTLESVWIQGKLRMWGRWSYLAAVRREICLTSCWHPKIDENSRQWSPAQDEKAGIEKPELEAFFARDDQWQAKDRLAHCTDAEALCIDRVISEVLAEHPGLISVLGNGMKDGDD